MDENNNWRYCVAGDIVRTRIDKDRVFRYGTSELFGYTKVYLSRNFFEDPGEEISIIGYTMSNQYQVVKVAPECIENIRCSKTYKPSVLNIMGDSELSGCWWDNTPEEKQSAEEFVRLWKARQSEVRRHRIYVTPEEHFRDSSYYEFYADFENPYLSGQYMTHLRSNRKYRGKAIIIREIYTKKTDTGEIITEGNVISVLSSIGEFFPVEEYEFT